MFSENCLFRSAIGLSLMVPICFCKFAGFVGNVEAFSVYNNASWKPENTNSSFSDIMERTNLF